MKRILMISIIIAAFALSISAFAASDDKAVSVMTAIGIIDEPDEEQLAEAITRADFADCLRKMLRYRDLEEQLVSGKPYNDVDIWHEAAGSIAYLKTLGIVDGTTDYNFLPDDNITFGAACKMLTAAAGYGEGYTAAFGQYPSGSVIAASGLGITDGVALPADAEITYGDAIVMLYNLLDVKYAEFDGVSGGNIELARGKKFSEEVMGLYSFRGVMTADGFISLYGEETGDNEIVVNGERYSTQAFYTDYIGMEVEGYAYDGDSAYMEVVWIAPRSSGDVLILDSEDIVKYENGVYTYYPDASSKTKTLSIPSSAPIVYNYAPTGRTDIMKPRDGEVRIIKDGSKVTAVIITEYETYCVERKDSVNKTVEMKDGGSVALSDSDIIYRSPEGRTLSFESIAANSVISIVKNDAAETKTVCIISNAAVSGTVNAMVSDEMGKYIITIGGTEYAVSPTSSITKGDTALFGAYVKAYMDYSGRLFYAEISRDESSSPYYRYGYLIRAMYDEENDKVVFKLLDQDGNIYKYDLKDKVTVDDDRLNKLVAYNRFLYNNEENITARQAIRYHLSENVIVKIQTGQNYVENTKVKDKFLIRANAKRYYYKPNGTFKRLLPVGTADRLTPEIIVSKDAVAFMVPPENAVSRTFDDSEFKVIKLSSVMSEDKACWIKAYNTDSERLDDDLIVYFHEKNYVFSKSDPFMMVTKVKTVYDEQKEETVTRVTGIGNNNTYTYDTREKDFFEPEGYKIKEGDLIRVINSDTDGMAAALELVFTPDYDGSVMGEHRAFYPTRSGIERNLGYSLIYGRMEKSNSGNIVVLSGTVGNQDREYFPVSGIPIYVYDEEADDAKAYRGSVDNLKIGARVLVVNFWAKPSYMFVYTRD